MSERLDRFDQLERLTAFGRELRDAGLPVGTGRIEGFCRAASLLPAEDLYWAGRTTLVARHDDLPVYDRVFRTFFGRETAPPEEPEREKRTVLVAVPAGDEPQEAPPSERSDREVSLASQREVLREKSFAECSPEELEQLEKLMAHLRLAAPPRRTRRRTPARRGELDVRRTVRAALRSGGEPMRLARRERRERPRRLILLLDISGSMTAYSRALLVFAHAALRTDRRWEAFCFGTRLTRVTRALAAPSLDSALAAAAAEVVDWEGGTRIGASLKTFLDRYGHSGLARGAIVVICSDGLDTGNISLLAEQMARLSRLAELVVWLNPLSADPEYQPLARGMAAALPYVDIFASGHNLASLEAIGADLAFGR